MEQCGIMDRDNADMSFTLDLSHHLADVQPISITRARRQTLDVPLSLAEGSQVAALIEELMWFQSQWDLTISGNFPSCKENALWNGTSIAGAQ